jgi:hypothetical protein
LSWLGPMLFLSFLRETISTCLSEPFIQHTHRRGSCLIVCLELPTLLFIYGRCKGENTLHASYFGLENMADHNRSSPPPAMEAKSRILAQQAVYQSC